MPVSKNYVSQSWRLRIEEQGNYKLQIQWIVILEQEAAKQHKEFPFKFGCFFLCPRSKMLRKTLSLVFQASEMK